MADRLVGAFQRPRHVALQRVQLGVPVDCGKRGAQLVAGVGDEAFHLLGRFLLLVEALLDTREHGVQRCGKGADFRVLRGTRNALAQITCSDFCCGFLDAFERCERTLNQDGRDDSADQHDGDAHQRAVFREGIHGVNLIAQRQADINHALNLRASVLGFLAPRQGEHSPRGVGRLQRGTADRAGTRAHDGRGGERLTDLDIAHRPVRRQVRYRDDVLPHHRNERRVEDVVVCVANLHEVVVRAYAALFAAVLAAQPVDVVVDQLRLLCELVVGFLQQIVAYELLDREGDARGAYGQQDHHARQQFGAQRDGVETMDQHVAHGVHCACDGRNRLRKPAVSGLAGRLSAFVPCRAGRVAGRTCLR